MLACSVACFSSSSKALFKTHFPDVYNIIVPKVQNLLWQNDCFWHLINVISTLCLIFFWPGKPTVMDKFCETGWRLLYYSVSWNYILCYQSRVRSLPGLWVTGYPHCILFRLLVWLWLMEMSNQSLLPMFLDAIANASVFEVGNYLATPWPHLSSSLTTPWYSLSDNLKAGWHFENDSTTTTVLPKPCGSCLEAGHLLLILITV